MRAPCRRRASLASPQRSTQRHENSSVDSAPPGSRPCPSGPRPRRRCRSCLRARVLVPGAVPAHDLDELVHRLVALVARRSGRAPGRSAPDDRLGSASIRRLKPAEVAERGRLLGELDRGAQSRRAPGRRPSSAGTMPRKLLGVLELAEVELDLGERRRAPRRSPAPRRAPPRRARRRRPTSPSSRASVASASDLLDRRRAGGADEALDEVLDLRSRAARP